MLYSDDEIRQKWTRLSNASKSEAFDAMEERMPEFAKSLRDQWDSGKALSPKQIAAILKWVKE